MLAASSCLMCEGDVSWRSRQVYVGETTASTTSSHTASVAHYLLSRKPFCPSLRQVGSVSPVWHLAKTERRFCSNAGN